MLWTKQTVEAEATPAEDKKGEKKEVGVKAVEEKEKETAMSKEDVEAAILKMLEFYFGDSNFGWDRFMQGKVGHNGTDAGRRYATIAGSDCYSS